MSRCSSPIPQSRPRRREPAQGGGRVPTGLPPAQGRAGRVRATVLLAALLVGALPGLRPLAAQSAVSPRDRLLVSVDWLADHLQDDDLVLLQVGREEDYPAGHIPGARYIQLADISAPMDEAMTGLSLEMPDPATLRSTFESLGISDDSRVVLYSSGNWFTHATRVILTLDWLELDNAALLDGGLDAWKAAGQPVTDAAPRVTRGHITAREPRRDLIVTADWVYNRLNAPGVSIIDARAPVYYDGTRPTYLHREPVRPGHIPGAANVPYTSIVDETLHVKGADELGAMFREAGVERGDTLVVYCHLGQQATAVVFAARTLGYDVRFYDGSFQEWGSMERLPVEGGQP